MPKKVGRPAKPLPKAKPEFAKALSTWLDLNDYIMRSDIGLKKLNELMQAAIDNDCPQTFILRIQRRINRLAGAAAIDKLVGK